MPGDLINVLGPLTNSDSYATGAGVVLSKDAAAGVLANDEGEGLVAALVAGSAIGGTVTLNLDGSFSFTPTAGFIGVGGFTYTATDTFGNESGPTNCWITVGDAAVFAHLASEADGESDIEGAGRGKQIWKIKADLRNRTAAEILASPKLPKHGDALYRYKLEAGAYRITRNYERDGPAVSGDIVVVHLDAKQEKDDPYSWTVTVSYEGKNDPTAELPEVSTQETEYQEYRTTDIYGRTITNSALDPFQGGMPVDESLDSLVITRNLPFDSWNTDIKRGFRHTLNLLPFRLGNQVDEDGDPILLPPGTVRLKRITEQRLSRSKSATLDAAKWYWKVTAELVIDQRTYPKYFDDGTKQKVPVKHRWVVADAGFNTLANGAKMPIMVAAQRPTEPQLLNGSGGLLVTPSSASPMPPAAAPLDGADVCAAIGRAYLYGTGALSRPAGELTGGCFSTTGNTGDLTAALVSGSAVGGAVTVGGDGSFTFTKTAGFFGYASFQYTVTAGGVTASAPATVTIFIGVQPVLLAFDRYEYADWSDLSALLENW